MLNAMKNTRTFQVKDDERRKNNLQIKFEIYHGDFNSLLL